MRQQGSQEQRRVPPEFPSERKQLSTKESETSRQESSFSELLEQYEREQEKPSVAGEGVFRGTVVSVRDDGVFVDIGRKSEAFLPLESSGNADDKPELKVGEAVEVAVTGRSPDGYLVLSRLIAERPATWRQLEAAFATGAPIACRVTEVVKGGLAVDVGVRGFLPASRSGVRDNAELEKLVGQEIRCRVIQLDIDDENVVVDRRVLLEEEKQRQRQEAIARLTPGAIVKGTVRSIRDFGAFVDLGGVDGLLHVSDISWAKVKDVTAALSEGDTLEVKVLKVEDGGNRISVGLKQLSPDPWTLIGDKLRVGDRVKGTVMRLMDFGAFVELQPGVEGLVHVSEMSWARRMRHPKDLLKTGEVIEVVVLDMNLAERRISLGIKQALGDPWERAEQDFPVGTVVEGVVRTLTKFGAFVEILEGVEGLIHVSEITSERRLNHPREVLKPGQKVKVAVLEFDREKRRLKLGMKQLEPDSQDKFMAASKPGDTVTGRVVSISEGQAFVELGEGVEGICSLRQQTDDTAATKTEPAPEPQDVSSWGEMLRVAWKGGSGASTPGAKPGSEALQPGQVRSFKILSVDPRDGTIKLELA